MCRTLRSQCPIVGFLLVSVLSTTGAEASGLSRDWEQLTPGERTTVSLATGLRGETGLACRAQDRHGVELQFRLTRFSAEAVPGVGASAWRLTMPGALLPGRPGAPDLPRLGRYVALPAGAKARIEVISIETQRIENITVAPAAETPVETETGEMERTPDAEIYAQDAFFPSEPVSLSDIRSLRGVDMVAVALSPLQYNPVQRELRVVTQLTVRIAFDGGGAIGEARLRSRYWEPILQQHLLNYASLPVPEFDRPRSEDGYEYVIITPDDSVFVAWADSLRAWRTQQGILTGVFTTTEIGGADTLAIRTWLHNAYQSWALPPAAFLLLGDVPGSGFRDVGIPAPVWDNSCASDNVYADVDGDDLPDMIPARIPAADSTQLAAMIGKLLAYERSPSLNPDVYAHPLFAGGWQEDRWFILCSEICLGFQEAVLGKAPVREYALCWEENPPRSEWSLAANTGTVVDYFGPDGLGYIPAEPSHLTDWSGDSTGISAAINDGAYLVLHRDHGLVEGWETPTYAIDHLDDLGNDAYPFVFSINCLSGKFDGGPTSFAEAILRQHEGEAIETMTYRGAVGVIAASQLSFSFVNDTMTWGIFDELWPEFDPGYPGVDGGRPLSSGHHRTAFALASGKYYLAASSWPQGAPRVDTYHLFHHHGDAFVQMYSEVPAALFVAHEDSCSAYAGSFSVTAEAGALIALTAGGKILCVEEATGLPQALPIEPIEAETLHVTVTQKNRLRYDADVAVYVDAQTVAGMDTPVLRLHVPLTTGASVPLRFVLPSPGEARLEVYDVAGACVARLAAGPHSAGEHRVVWDAPSRAGGVYFARLRSGGCETAEKLIVVK